MIEEKIDAFFHTKDPEVASLTADAKLLNRKTPLCPPECFKKIIKPNLAELRMLILREQVGNLLLGPYEKFLPDSEILPLLQCIAEHRGI